MNEICIKYKVGFVMIIPVMDIVLVIFLDVCIIIISFREK